MAEGFTGTGAKVVKAGKGFNVVHGSTGAVLRRFSTRAAAEADARETRDRNITSTMRSANNRQAHPAPKKFRKILSR